MASDPDQTIDHVPTTCTGCGHGLDEGSGVGYQRRQVRDIPR